MRYVLAVISLLLIGPGTSGAETTIRLSLQVEPSPWGSGDFAGLLHEAINRSWGNEELRWEALPDGWLIAPDEPAREQDKNSRKGSAEARSLTISIHVQSSELITKKTFDAPGLFHNYGVFGEAHARLRITERSSGKILADEELVQSRRGPHVLQLGIDGDRNDPDLQMTALVKQRFFTSLETDLAGSLASRLASFTR